MPTDNEPPILSVLPAPPSPWDRWKRRAILVGVLGVVALVAFLSLWHTFFVFVKPGHHLIVLTKFGTKPPSNRVLAEEGEEGIQAQVRGEGWHFFWPVIYSTEVQANTVIPAGKVGIVTARGGEILAPGQDLAEEGQQGIQRHVLLPGEYRLNRRGYDVDIVSAVEVKAGHVGVQRRLLGKNKGIQPEVLQPGLYYLNTKETEVIPNMEVGIHQTTFRFDPNPLHNSAIKFTSRGGFEISMDCTVEWEVLPEDTPAIVQEYGDHQKLERVVIQQQAQAISRDKGIDYGVQDLLEGAKREKFQNDFHAELVQTCKDKKVVIRSAFIRDIVIPEAYLKPIREKQIALETERTNQAKEATATTLTAVERERLLVLQRVAEVEAETARMVATVDREVQNIGTRTQAEVDKMKADFGSQIATLEAERDQVLGVAKAEATKLKETAKSSLYQLKMDIFQTDPNAFLRYTLAEALNPNMKLRLMHSGPGTFWTNMEGKGMNLLLPTPGSAPAKDKP